MLPQMNGLREGTDTALPIIVLIGLLMLVLLSISLPVALAGGLLALILNVMRSAAETTARTSIESHQEVVV
jgi:hypothetical protein